MKINNLGYLLKEGIRGIFLRGFMSFAAVCVTVACLLIVGSFSSIMYNVNIMVEDLNKTNEISVWVNRELSEAEAKSIGTQINRIENVYKAEFVSNEQVLADYVATKDNPEAYSGFVGSDIPHLYKVTLVDNKLIDTTVAQIGEIKNVVSIVAAYELAESFSALQDVLRVASAVVISMLLLISLLIISNTVKLAMYDRRDEIAIMKMVGATNGFIRLPFVVEGFTLGMLGAGIAFGLEWLLYDFTLERIGMMGSLDNLLSFVPFQELLIPMVAVFVAAGLFVGVVGSWTSIRKFLDV